MSLLTQQFSPETSNDYNADLSVIQGDNHHPQFESVMDQLSRLSQSFVHSYQNLEGQVERLSDQLQSEAAEKYHAIAEKQKILDEKLKLSDRLQNLLAVMPSGVIVLDGQGVVRDCNAKAIDILGRPLLGEVWVSVIRRAFQPQADDGHQVSLKDGRKIHIETKGLDAEPGQLIILTDMTKTRQLQAALSQQQKLSSMGKMIAFLAHQIRTPLSAAILYGSHLTQDNLNQGLQRQFSNNLLERLNYMERQINDMLNFVKGERKQKSTFSAHQLCQTLQTLAEGSPYPVQMMADCRDLDNRFIQADIDALVGAITNLLNNAHDACATKSTAEIRLSISFDKCLKLVVEDNGCGIDADKKERIFEPFYTGKSHGNGLGLAIVYGVVLDHQGSIHVESTPGQGTQFIISLPTHPLAEQNHSSLQQEKINEF